MVNSFRTESASVSDRGLSEKRPQNEDSFLEIPGSGIFAVADGVGGAQAGEVASQMAMEILGEAFNNFPPNADAEDVMRTALERANGAIFQMSSELAQLSQMATTVVALHLSDNIATIGHVGDSRLYRLDGDGQLIQETADHSMVAEEVRAGRMTEEQAENHPGKNIISRALGAEATVDIDLKTMMIDSESTFLICSDGVTRHIGDREIGELLRSGDEPTEICHRIKDICFERGAEDNLTAVIIKLTGDEHNVVEGPAATETEEPFDEADTLKFQPDEEATIASSRPGRDDGSDDDLDDDELLELDTVELTVPRSVSSEPDLFAVDEPEFGSEEHEASVLPVSPETALEPETEDEPDEVVEEYVATEPTVPDDIEGGEHEIVMPAAPPAEPEDRFSMFGNSGEAETTVTGSSGGSLGKIASMVGLLLIGSIIGLLAYHFLLVPPEKPDQLAITEMRSPNIPLSTFEQLRRNVDNDPVDYISKNAASPQDCEDHYLLGRAYLLTGDYAKARLALTEARNRLAGADPGNAKTLAIDIATLIAVTNDTTIQSILKNEIETTKPPANVPR